MEQKRAVFQMRLRPSDGELFLAIDAWRAGKITGNREMSQSEAIRRLCREALGYSELREAVKRGKARVEVARESA